MPPFNMPMVLAQKNHMAKAAAASKIHRIMAVSSPGYAFLQRKNRRRRAWLSSALKKGQWATLDKAKNETAGDAPQQDAPAVSEH